MSEANISGGSRSVGLTANLIMWVITFSVVLQAVGGRFLIGIFPQLWQYHQWFGTAILVVFVILRVMTRSVPFRKNAMMVYNLTGVLMLIQVSIGGMMRMNPMLLKMVHLWVGILLLVSVISLQYFFRYGAER